MRTEIRLAGSGGQGLLLAGAILADAVGVFEKRHVVQTNSYGPEARGGASKCEVVVSDEPIDFPKVERLDVLLAMSKKAYEKYSEDLPEKGLLLVDTTNIPEGARPEAVKVPMTQLAIETTGKSFTANLVALGALVAATGIVKKESAESAVKRRVPKGTEDLNIKAFEAGYEYVKKGTGV
jgi:2-oxoglutarate ferredoxin oxidoreductase subunit gamma